MVKQFTQMALKKASVVRCLQHFRANDYFSTLKNAMPMWSETFFRY